VLFCVGHFSAIEVQVLVAPCNEQRDDFFNRDNGQKRCSANETAKVRSAGLSNVDGSIIIAELMAQVVQELVSKTGFEFACQVDEELRELGSVCSNNDRVKCSQQNS
jgi:hypothetical protein